MTKLLILGATGYIGGSVLPALLSSHPDLEVTALVRNPVNGPAVQALRPSPPIRIIVGDKGDFELIAAESRDADVVLAALDCDNVSHIQAIIKGLEERALTRPALKPALIHTSGTGVTAYGNDGNFREGPIYDDSRPGDIKSIPAENPHRPVDNEIFAAQARGNILTYIICPSMVYGPGRGPCKMRSPGLYFWIQLALKHGAVPVINQGTATWSDVHIDDVVDLYTHVFARTIEDSESPPSLATPFINARAGDNLPESAYENFYFCSAQPFAFRDRARTILAELVRLGKLPNTVTEPISIVSGQSPLLQLMSTNTPLLPTRAEREFGWKPHRPSFSATLGSEIESHLVPASL